MNPYSEIFKIFKIFRMFELSRTSEMFGIFEGFGHRKFHYTVPEKDRFRSLVSHFAKLHNT